MKNKFKALIISACVALMLISAPIAKFMGFDFSKINIFSSNAEAETVTSGTCGDALTWTFDEDSGELVISGTGKMTNFTSPNVPWCSFRSKITNITIKDGVTSISSYAFYECSKTTSIIIPNSLTNIGYYAFRGCTGLTSITIPDSVTSIGDDAFEGCSGLKTVYYTGNITKWCAIHFGNYDSNPTYYTSELYINGTKIEGNLEIPDGITSIGTYAFENCTGLTNIKIPDSVTSIGQSAFYGCTGLTSVTIGNSVTSIGSQAFYGCTGLTSITIGNSVTSIGDYAFYGCTGLTSITIPNSVTSIGRYAFEGCSGLTSITIPNSVTSIGHYAFEGCSGLKTVYYTGNITKWCAIDFENYDSNPTSYASELYINGTKIEGNLEIPDGITSIGDHAFQNCIELTSVTIPDSVTSIGNCAFYGCTSLTSVTIPDSVTSIGDNAFSGCTGLKAAYYPGTPEQWSKKSIYHDRNLELIYAIIYECNSENSYYNKGICGAKASWVLCGTGELIISGTGTMADGVPWKKYENKIIRITINEGISNIQEKAFSDCTSLKSISIPNSVKVIGNRAFDGCSKLAIITIPSSVTNINTCVFENCTSLTNINVEANNLNYSSIDGVLFNKDVTKLIEYPAGKEEKLYSIPDSVTSIGDYAFQNCTGLTSITIPGSVTSIGSDAFRGCTGLTSITIPGSVTSIGIGAFYGCTGLTSITIPDSVTRISSNMFEDCTSLTSITIPDSVTSIDWYAFNGCTGLTSITIPGSVTSISSNTFEDCTGLTSIAISGTVTSIRSEAFYNCSKLTDVYYSKSKDDWNNISISSGNDCLIAANIYYDWCSSDNHKHTVEHKVEKPTCIADGKEYDYCTFCGETLTTPIITKAKGHLDFDGDKYCDACKEFMEDVIYNYPSISIKANSVAVSLNGTITLCANIGNMPTSAKVIWAADKNIFELTPSADGLSCEVKAVSSGTATVTAKIVDKNGNSLRNADGEEIVALQALTVESKTEKEPDKQSGGFFDSIISFFQKIIAFFKSLFALNFKS